MQMQNAKLSWELSESHRLNHGESLARLDRRDRKRRPGSSVLGPRLGALGVSIFISLHFGVAPGQLVKISPSSVNLQKININLLSYVQYMSEDYEIRAQWRV